METFVKTSVTKMERKVSGMTQEKRPRWIDVHAPRRQL